MASSRLIITGTNATIPDDAAQSCEGEIGSNYAVCPDCSGDGWVYGWGINPSDKFKAECRYCGGHGAIPRKNKVRASTPARDTVARSVALPVDVERATPRTLPPRITSPRGTLAFSHLGKSAPLFDATAGRWIVPPPGMKPDGAASLHTGYTQERTRTQLSSLTDPSPAAQPHPAAGRLDAALDFAVTVLGLTVFGLIASFFLVLA